MTYRSGFNPRGGRRAAPGPSRAGGVALVKLDARWPCAAAHCYPLCALTVHCEPAHESHKLTEWTGTFDGHWACLVASPGSVTTGRQPSERSTRSPSAHWLVPAPRTTAAVPPAESPCPGPTSSPCKRLPTTSPSQPAIFAGWSRRRVFLTSRSASLCVSMSAISMAGWTVAASTPSRDHAVGRRIRRGRPADAVGVNAG